jgi:hypothetical protein
LSRELNTIARHETLIDARKIDWAAPTTIFKHRPLFNKAKTSSHALASYTGGEPEAEHDRCCDGRLTMPLNREEGANFALGLCDAEQR